MLKDLNKFNISLELDFVFVLSNDKPGVVFCRILIAKIDWATLEINPDRGVDSTSIMYYSYYTCIYITKL